jgi:hypothetical protein
MNVEIWVQYLMKKNKYLEREKLFPSHNLHNLGYTVYERKKIWREKMFSETSFPLLGKVIF